MVKNGISSSDFRKSFLKHYIDAGLKPASALLIIPSTAHGNRTCS